MIQFSNAPESAKELKPIIAFNASEIKLMKFFDQTFPTPAENLACDEALLDWREENCGTGILPVSANGGILRFWESPEIFAVVGYANKIATEVNVAACEKNKISILRRCSGGGTVLQGCDCLNYALILRIAENSSLTGISSANQFIMERNRAAIKSILPNSQLPSANCKISGHTDLTINGKKFSGNSQRRHKNFLLFHGTFLLNFDLKLVHEFLQMPSKEPNYRQSRSHLDFLTNLNLPAADVKNAMQKIWKANSVLENPPLEKISKLAREKYSTRDWNWKF